jgi:hypothetical protein
MQSDSTVTAPLTACDARYRRPTPWHAPDFRMEADATRSNKIFIAEFLSVRRGTTRDQRYDNVVPTAKKWAAKG